MARSGSPESLSLLSRARLRRGLPAVALGVALVAAWSLMPGGKGIALGDARPQAPDDEVLIREVLKDQYAALLAMDADRYASHLAPDAAWENALGDRYEGREAVREFNSRVAATVEGARYEGWELQVAFLTPEVAVADVRATLRGQQVGGRTLVDRPMLNVYVLRKEGDRWWVAHTRIRDRWTLAYLEP